MLRVLSIEATCLSPIKSGLSPAFAGLNPDLIPVNPLFGYKKKAI